MLARGQRSAGYLNINEVVWLDSSRMRQRWMEVITIHKLGLCHSKISAFRNPNVSLSRGWKQNKCWFTVEFGKNRYQMHRIIRRTVLECLTHL